MAMIGHIKSIIVEDGQVIATIETGAGPAVTATVMPIGSLDFQPLPGDSVLFHRSGQEICISAVFSEDNQAGPGEAVLFARSGPEIVTAVVHLKADGKIEIKPFSGKTAEVGNGADFVAMATPVAEMWTILSAAMAVFTPPGTPDGGAALAAAIQVAIDGAGLNYASTNLKAD